MHGHFPNKSIWLEGDASPVIQGLKASSLLILYLLFYSRYTLDDAEAEGVKNFSHTKGNFCADWVTKWTRELGSDIMLTDEFLSH